MSDLLNDEPHSQDDRVAAREPVVGAHREQSPDPAWAGRAQRSEPERSDGERSGARPAPSATPPLAEPRHTPATTPAVTEDALFGTPPPLESNLVPSARLAQEF